MGVVAVGVVVAVVAVVVEGGGSEGGELWYSFSRVVALRFLASVPSSYMACVIARLNTHRRLPEGIRRAARKLVLGTRYIVTIV